MTLTAVGNGDDIRAPVRLMKKFTMDKTIFYYFMLYHRPRNVATPIPSVRDFFICYRICFYHQSVNVSI